jgi:hypothetical protein
MTACPTLLAAALDLAARGLSVFPLHFPVRRRGTLVCSCWQRNCSNAAKHPFGSLVPHGVKDATTDQQQVEKWWRQYPQVNVGLSTASLVILDIDPRHNGYESLAALEQQHDVIPHTWCVRTGSGGLHIYLAAPSSSTISNSAGKLGPGLDIRAKGGSVVAPPSRHITGDHYRWIFDPDEAPLAPIPDWLVTKLTEPIPRPQPQISIATSHRPSVAAVRGVLCVVASAREGERNAVLFWAACRLGEAVRNGLMSSDMALDLLVNSAPPTDASFTRRAILLTARNGLRHGAGQ